MELILTIALVSFIKITVVIQYFKVKTRSFSSPPSDSLLFLLGQEAILNERSEILCSWESWEKKWVLTFQTYMFWKGKEKSNWFVKKWDWYK